MSWLSSGRAWYGSKRTRTKIWKKKQPEGHSVSSSNLAEDGRDRRDADAARDEQQPRVARVVEPLACWRDGVRSRRDATMSTAM